MKILKKKEWHYFYDLNEEKTKKLFTKVGLKVVNQWVKSECKRGCKDEVWLNIVYVKRFYRCGGK